MVDTDTLDSWGSEQDFRLHVEKELALLREMTSFPNWIKTAVRHEVIRKVHNLKGAAAMVGYPAISPLFDGMERSLEQAHEYSEAQLQEKVREGLTRAMDLLRAPAQPSATSAPSAPARPVPTPEPAEASAATMKRLKALNILVVDDDPSFRSHMRLSWQPLGMTIFEMDRGTDLTPEYLEKKKIDVVLLDVRLPGEDGYAICKRLKANSQSCHIPIVFVSVVRQLESRLFGWQVGAEDFIVKPVVPLELLLRVEFLVEKAKAKRDQAPAVGVTYEAFLKELEKEVRKALSGGKPCSLATLSLTGAKAEPKQRAAGAEFLLNQLRRGDVLCSPSAGYLMVLQAGTPITAARKNFEALAKRLHHDFGLNCRVGLAACPTHAEARQDLLAACKECLDKALQSGKESSVVTPSSRKAEEPRPPRLVLVDDDEPFLRHLGRHFAERGYHAYLVADSNRAVEAIRREQPDLVTLDIMMPEPDGLAILETLKRDPELAAIPVIMVSGKGEEESLVQAFDQGASDYLVKPFRFPELDARVHKVLRERIATE
jgi:DNA-binding response OmpR family regulator/HPt (histidine-containing phosphotransfer) domain-containing protein